jgi:hypothetical protein
MRILWTVLKVIIGLAIAIPVGILALALTVGVLGTMLGLAFLMLKLALVGLVGYGLFRVVRSMFGSSRRTPPPTVHELPGVDPYYEAAMRDLDAEFRGSGRS